MGDDEKGAMAMVEGDGDGRETVVRVVASDDKDRQGQGWVRASEHRHGMRQEDQKGDHGTVGSRIVAQSGITQRKKGKQAAVAFYINWCPLAKPGVGYIYARYSEYSTCKVSKKI